MTKILSRDEILLSTKQDYLSQASSALNIEISPSDFRILACRLTEADARKKADELIAGYASSGTYSKLAAKIKATQPSPIRKEYLTVVRKDFHVSEAEYIYWYHYEGRLIDIKPKKKSLSYDYTSYVSASEGLYPTEQIKNVGEDDCVETFEKGFAAHKLLAADASIVAKKCAEDLDKNLNAAISEVLTDELGTLRKFDSVRIVNKTCQYDPWLFAVPTYIINYDLGKEIVSIVIDAFSCKASLINNNPLTSISTKRPNNPPQFNIVICIVCGLIAIGIGAIGYALYYLDKKKKYDKTGIDGNPAYSVAEMRKLI